MKVALLGASGLAREAVAVAAAMTEDGNDVEVVGFIDISADPGDRIAGLPVLGDESWFARPGARDVRAVPAMGSPAQRRRAVAGVRRHGGRFATLIHPTVCIGTRVRVGEGCLMLPLTSLTTDIEVGDFVSLNPGCTIGHDARIGSFVNLSPGTRISGGVDVREGADLGAGAVVLPGLRVGRDAVVGAGAVVVRDVADGITVVGVPARPLVRSGASAGTTA